MKRIVESAFAVMFPPSVQKLGGVDICTVMNDHERMNRVGVDNVAGTGAVAARIVRRDDEIFEFC